MSHFAASIDFSSFSNMSIPNKVNLQTHVSPFVLPQTQTPRCAINEEGIIIYANDAFQNLFDSAELQGKHVFNVLNFSDNLFDDEGDITSLTAGDHDVHISGNPIITSLHFDWIETVEGRKYLIASTMDEDTETAFDDSDLDLLINRIQKSAARIEAAQTPEEERAQPSREDFAAFISMSHDIMIICDAQGKILDANDTFKNLLGYEKTMHAMSLVSLFDEQDKHLVRTNIHNLVTEESIDPEQTIDFESRIYTANGDTRWVEWKQKSQNGKVYSTGRDITDIKRQKNNLLRRQKQLSEAEAIGRMGHWQWIIGEDNISWSEEIYRIFGVDAHDFKPSINSLTDLVHKRDLGRVVQVFQRAIIEEKDYDMEFRIVRPGGDVRYIMCEGRCEKNEEGEVIALFGIMQDMTERMLYEEELRRAKDASEQAYAAKSQFLANMSHELRTPLNAIIGFSEMIESQMLGPIFNEKYLEYATSIKESGEHLLDLISDILDMSKIEAGKHTLDLEEVNLQDIIARASHMVQGRATEDDITLRTEHVEHSDVTLQADRRALTQILLNLLSNAIKFTPPHGSVWIECSPREEGICIKVCDSGIGIPPNKLAAVMRPFEQASSHFTRDHEGTGLGLSITKELIELHGGSIHIESTVDVGTTVSVRLPYVQQN